MMESNNFDRNQESNATNAQSYPLKWHKFLIYFGLWVGALYGGLYSAWRLFSGTIYGYSGEAASVYAVFPDMKTVDCVFGVLYLLYAAFAIYTRFQLAGFRAEAPGKLTIMYVFSLALQLIYMGVTSFVSGIGITELFGSNVAASLIGAMVGIVINRAYYSKREALFVN